MDALIAEKVMGWKKDGNGWWVTSEYKTPDGWDWKSRSITPNFTESISWAWLVGEKVGGLWGVGYAPGRKVFTAYFQPRIQDATVRGSADTAPRAICVAALLTFGVEVPE